MKDKIIIISQRLVIRKLKENERAERIKKMKKKNELKKLIDKYTNEFPNDKEFLDLFEPSFDIDQSKLISMLKKRKKGKRIITKFTGNLDQTDLIYD